MLATNCLGEMSKSAKQKQIADIENSEEIAKAYKENLRFAVDESSGTAFLDGIKKWNKKSFLGTMVCLGALEAYGKEGGGTVNKSVWEVLSEEEQISAKGYMGIFWGMDRTRMPRIHDKYIEAAVNKYRIHNQDVKDISFMCLYLSLEYALEKKYDKASKTLEMLKNKSGDPKQEWLDDSEWEAISNEYNLPKASIYQYLNEVDEIVEGRGNVDFTERAIKNCVKDHISSLSYNNLGWNDNRVHSIAIPENAQYDTDVYDFNETKTRARFETALKFNIWRADGDGSTQTIYKELVGNVVKTVDGWKVDKIRERR
jgi:hypothetical protein